MADHHIGIAGDSDWQHYSRAWQVGYIRGLLQALGIWCAWRAHSATPVYEQLPATPIRQGAERRLAHTDNLMMVVVDFTTAPRSSRTRPTATRTSRSRTWPMGKILFVMEGQQTHLEPGDVFLVPSGSPTLSSCSASTLA